MKKLVGSAILLGMFLSGSLLGPVVLRAQSGGPASAAIQLALRRFSAVPVLNGQWTVNGVLCAAGTVVQGGSPTTCTGGPTLSTGLIIGSGVVDTNHQIAITANVNGETGDRLVNSSTGTGAFANRVLQVGTTLAYFGASGQNYPAGGAGGGRSWLDTSTTSGAGWDYSAPASNGTHRWYTGGYAAGNQRLQVDSNGANVFGKLQINGVDFAVGSPCSNTGASTDISGTLTKTYFSVSCKIPANTLATIGDFVKLSMRGLYSGNATDTMTMTLEACQVSGCASGTKVTIHTAAAVTLTAVSNQGWELDTQIVSFTTGAGGTHDAQGKIFYELTGTTATPDWLPNTAVVTWDDTVDEYLTMSVTFSTTSGNDHASIRNLAGTIQ